MIRKFDWKELEKGDRIKATGGPYCLVDGEFIPMGCRGKFTVIHTDKDGIVAYGAKEGGFCHIWMGNDSQCKLTGTWKTKHRLAKLQQKKQKV